MIPGLSEPLRQVFVEIANVLIPEAEGMPSASQIGVGGDVLDRILELRSDVREDFLRGLNAAEGKSAKKAVNEMNQSDPSAFGAIGLVASAAYYMNPEVRKLIGYPGQEDSPTDPDEEPEYVSNGMLQQVIDRGPIFRPTPPDDTAE